ncbi:Adenosine 3'-phospho 5'-phosphosulfate transporter 1 [Orchesella cincta]|uniref:Adenosine 3'-phospho 5'-phosphosulfate transporter 1 n=1 Tax=Orchesella cincta TaxID=48709 RepID=A0A1D2MY21_ORCCI|nr:Adenosine 3'-phospho 5'-phosphosulfate transporter 1 [Orchesella cincta]
MRMHHQDISICIFLLGSAAVLYLISSQFQSAAQSLNASWVYRLFANLLGYGVVFIPGYIIIKYIHRINYIDRSRKQTNLKKGLLMATSTAMHLWTGRRANSILRPSTGFQFQNWRGQLSGSWFHNVERNHSPNLLFCRASSKLLSMGLLQEKIMTQTYGDGENFRDSQFLVFINRILALVIAWVYLAIYERGTIKSLKEAPLYKYSYCAFSNIMSSWFQYEALKFVSFPTQVLAKSCKIIPVMLMGKVISRQTYEFYEYFTAVLMSFGMVLFLSGSSDYIKTGVEAADITTSGLSGLIILTFYMVFDSFTSNWQSELFRVYKVSSVRMMAGVNLFSCLLTGVSLLQQGTMFESVGFMLQHSDFAVDCMILSICSAVGQLFIYYTIETFGAVIFIIIMTIRQAMAVLLSCIMYSHPISAIGIIGVTVVFVSVFLRTYCAYRLKQLRRTKGAPSTSNLGSGTKV